MQAQDHWQGRTRYTVFDSDYGDGARVAALIAAWRADPQRPRHLHVVALATDLQPGFHRIPQPDGGVTLDAYLWGFVDGTPIVNDWPDGARPARTELSDRLSKDLGKRGFKFVGSTIVYAYMQGIGMVDDHDRDCLCRTRR